MSRVIRSAMISVRVTPGVKRAAEEVLHRIGLNVTEAMELFFRRVIIDQRIPFEVVAFDDATHKRVIEDWQREATAKVRRGHRKSKAPRRTE
jgi:addiction module RelB/DinJ family antitoxin